ncbi:MAG: hypothetical protein NC543_09040 [bacterium]|nr:hypothetical protein [bacterium]MCM1375758.1 hypothetical protein [Muribaculum sp.]
MKKIILIILSTALLVTLFTNPVVADETCKHSHGTAFSTVWIATGRGYAHAYLVAENISAGCDVNIEQLYVYKPCPCGQGTILESQNVFRENHSVKSHNTW